MTSTPMEASQAPNSSGLSLPRPVLVGQRAKFEIPEIPHPWTNNISLMFSYNPLYAWAATFSVISQVSLLQSTMQGVTSLLAMMSFRGRYELELSLAITRLRENWKVDLVGPQEHLGGAS